MSQPHDPPDPRPAVDDTTLHRYHDGELGPAEAARLEASLDDASRAKLGALDELGGALRAIYQPPAAAFDAWPTLERAITESQVIPLSRRRRRAPIWVSTLAVAAAVLALVLFPRGGHPSNECQIDDLEVTGATATILKIADDQHGGSTTVLWLEE